MTDLYDLSNTLFLEFTASLKITSFGINLSKLSFSTVVNLCPDDSNLSCTFFLKLSNVLLFSSVIRLRLKVFLFKTGVSILPSIGISLLFNLTKVFSPDCTIGTDCLLIALTILASFIQLFAVRPPISTLFQSSTFVYSIPSFAIVLPILTADIAPGTITAVLKPVNACLPIFSDVVVFLTWLTPFPNVVLPKIGTEDLLIDVKILSASFKTDKAFAFSLAFLILFTFFNNSGKSSALYFLLRSTTLEILFSTGFPIFAALLAVLLILTVLFAAFAPFANAFKPPNPKNDNPTKPKFKACWPGLSILPSVK